jgi:TraB/PrgY/gumN family
VRVDRWLPVLCGCLSLALAGAAQAGQGTSGDRDAPADLAPLQEIDVLGEQPGPGLWKVTRGDHVLWLLGTLDHVPRRMTWRSRSVEAALKDSQVLLPAGPAVSARLGPILLVRLYVQWRGVQRDPDHTRLHDWLPAPLYARFEALKARYDPGDRRIEELRPPFAALRLYRRALDAAGLTRTNEVEHSVEAMGGRLHVPIQRVRLRVRDPLDTLKQVRALSPGAEVNCLATTVQRLETDLPVMQQRARAWAIGDLDALRALPYPDQLEACVTELSAAPIVASLVAEASQAWMNAAEEALANHRVSFATLPIYQLLDSHGPLARFRAEGDRVQGPG